MDILQDSFVLERLQPKEYYRRWLDSYSPIRPDQRRLDEFRPLSVLPGVIGSADSSAMVRLGETTVTSGTRIEVSEPAILESSSGFLVINVTLASGCSSSVRPGPPNDRAQTLSHAISSLIKSFEILPLNSLVIEVGKLVWCVHVDTIVLSDCGNLFDAAWIATIAALKDLKIPFASSNPDTGLICVDESNIMPISLNPRIPIPISFRWIPYRSQLIVDPTDREESILEDEALVLVDPKSGGEILYIETMAVPLKVIKSMVSASPDITRYLQSTFTLLAG
jgi:exosome complex component RRP43